MDPQTAPTVSTSLTAADTFGHWAVRWGIRRMHYRVDPGLYAVGDPDEQSPVLASANYKLSFDTLRSSLAGVDAWILVLDTHGINVWCAAGKGTFGTRELVTRMQAVGLGDVVSHRTVILPQLGAPGVSAQMVKQLSGVRVVYGPVRAEDIKAFLDAGMRASDEMRHVRFPLSERLVLTSMEIVVAAKWLIPLMLGALFFAGGLDAFTDWRLALGAMAPIAAGLLAGTVLTPALLPWIPGRAFSLKGAIVGALAVGATLAVVPAASSPFGVAALFLLGTVLSSYAAMNYTGSSTFTSPSGVEWEMRRAIPLQVGAVVLAVILGVLGWFVG